MNSALVGLVVFGCSFGGVLVGVAVRSRVPEHHLQDSSRQSVQLGIGLIATMSALVLGLVTASAKSAFDTLDTTIKHTAADLLSLDRTLARYGPETNELRQALKTAIAHRVDQIWQRGSSGLDPNGGTRAVEELASRIRALTPKTEDQRWLQSRALDISEQILETRWQIFAGLSSSIPLPFLTILIFWLTVTFGSFGLFAPRNATVLATLFVCALSVAAAVFLVLELDAPFDGMIRVSPAPLEYAVSHMGE